MALMILNLQFQPCLYPQQLPRTAPSRATTTTRATCSASASDAFSVETISTNCDARRTANYHPNIWDFEFIQSLKTEYTGNMYVRHAEKLKEIVRSLFDTQDMGCLGLLELIDVLQKVGIGYHFEKEICRSLDVIDTYNNNTFQNDEDLHAVSLRFRLLRQHGYYISQDVFARFKDENGAFDVNLAGDFKGLLSLYEASHLAVEGEDILDEARSFASKHLQKIRTRKQVSRSLELPLHWRITRLDTRWYLEDGLSTDNHINSDILELAKLDFNMVQGMHQNELREMSRWWRDLGLGSHEQLSFARDRLMENYLWTIGVHFYPQNSYCRKGLTKVNSLITTIDDVYDVYGSLEELELFTDAVERWDLNAIEQLPYYMKICFLALYNTVNEIAYVALAEHGLDITRFLKKSWTDLCKSYLVEAKWYYNKYTPTLEEYLNNAWISISGPVILVHAYVFLKQEHTEEALKYLGSYPDIVRCSSMILRLCDDLGTSTAEIERGDVPKSIQCYMKQTGSSEESARIHIRHLISETWKKMNKSRVYVSLFPKPFLRTAVDLARMAHCMYQYGDGHGVQNRETKDRVMALLVKPIALSEFTTN